MARTQVDDGIPVRTPQRGFRLRPLPVVVLGVAALFLVLMGSAVAVFSKGKSATAVAASPRTEPNAERAMPARVTAEKTPSIGEQLVNKLLPTTTVSPRSDNEGVNWTVEDLANWLKSKGRIASWEFTNSTKVAVYLKMTNGDVVAIQQNNGPIAAELEARPHPDMPRHILDPSKICWGRFSTNMCGHNVGVSLFLGLDRVRESHYDGLIPITVPIDGSATPPKKDSPFDSLFKMAGKVEIDPRD